MVSRLKRFKFHRFVFLLTSLLICHGSAAKSLFADPAALVEFPVGFRLSQAISDEVGLENQGFASSEIDDLLPSHILSLDASVQHVVLADLQEKRVYLLENRQRLRVIREMYGTIGKNGSGKQIEDDGRTPLGIYTVTRYIHDDALPELYGVGAFPIDYPNQWDRWLNRTGYGIWIHGVPRDKYTRAPLSSEGCVAVGNEDLLSLKPFILPGNTRVIFSDNVDWKPHSAVLSSAQDFQTRLNNWVTAWESRDTDKYLEFYADEFSTANMDRETFALHKRAVNSGKSFIDVDIDKLNIFEYPDGENIRLVEFQQTYNSNNYQSVDAKQQYWQLGPDNQWYILRETSL